MNMNVGHIATNTMNAQIGVNAKGAHFSGAMGTMVHRRQDGGAQNGAHADIPPNNTVNSQPAGQATAAAQAKAGTARDSDKWRGFYKRSVYHQTSNIEYRITEFQALALFASVKGKAGLKPTRHQVHAA